VTTHAPIEAKVKTSTLASTITALALGLASQYLFQGGEVPDFVETLISSVVLSGVTGAVTFVVGWTTRHTPRFARIEEDRTP
jgi:ribose/xylose/arabinose/galactoside ABC-type transport system permease subunit